MNKHVIPYRQGTNKRKKEILFRDQAKLDCHTIGRIAILIQYSQGTPLVIISQRGISIIFNLPVDPIFYGIDYLFECTKFGEISMSGTAGEVLTRDVTM